LLESQYGAKNFDKNCPLDTPGPLPGLLETAAVDDFPRRRIRKIKLKSKANDHAAAKIYNNIH
jgi:hypothetical protein